MEGILKDCDNDVIKAIKKLYNQKPQNNSNPFVSNNQENRFNQLNNVFNNNSKFQGQLTSFTALKRKRKFNEMSCDSPVSNKTISNDSDEEEKEQIAINNDEKLCDDYSRYLLEHLKTIPSEENAFLMIKKCMLDYKNRCTSTSNNLSGAQKKSQISDKDKKMISDAIKTLVKDNVILKSAVRKLVEKDDKNAEKLNQFENLAQAYQRLNEENTKLRQTVDILSYAAREKCSDRMFDYHNGNHGSSGGPGIF